MKYSTPKILNVFLSLAACLLSFSSCNPGDTTPPPIPQPTPKGTPTGVATSQTIGPAGGIVSTLDGKISLTFPANALPSDTDIVIQPITDEAPGGLGNSYRLEPEGATFAQPVEVAFSYTDADLLGSSTDALGIAYQDDEGFWHQPTATLDPARREIKVQTTHFSGFSALLGLQLQPGEATVKVGKSVELRVVSCERVDEGDGLVTLVGTCKENNRVFNRSSEWSVNGTRGGSATMGRVTVGAGMATYTAPLQKPPETANPVMVSTKITDKEGKKTLLVSNIKVVDADVGWSGTISYTMSGTKTITDSGSGADGSFTSTDTYSASGDGSITVADDNPLAAGFLRYTAGTGTYNYSRVMDYENTVQKGDCIYHSTSHEKETLSGLSSLQGSESGSVNVQPDGSYEIAFNTLGGDTAGHAVTTGSQTVTDGCSQDDFTPTDYPVTGTIPVETLSVKGIIDPKKPNVLEGIQPVEVDTNTLLPMTYEVTWNLTR
jgi:hypothetical protein